MLVLSYISCSEVRSSSSFLLSSLCLLEISFSLSSSMVNLEKERKIVFFGKIFCLMCLPTSLCQLLWRPVSPAPCTDPPGSYKDNFIRSLYWTRLTTFIKWRTYRRNNIFSKLSCFMQTEIKYSEFKFRPGSLVLAYKSEKRFYRSNGKLFYWSNLQPLPICILDKNRH